MESTELIKINKKLETLFEYEKGLAGEIKKTNQKDIEIEKELEIVKNKIEYLEHQVSLLEKKSSPELINHRTLSPVEIAKLKEKLSWSELAEYLKCSVSTCQRLVRKGREVQRDGNK